MGMQPARQDGLAALGDALGHQHGFRGRGRAIIERGIGHLHAGQQCHLGLEFEQILQGALGDFRLVGRVAGEEFGTLDQVIHGSRNMMLVRAAADKERHRAGRHVHRGKPSDFALDLDLGFRQRQIGERPQPFLGRNVGE